MSTQVQTLLIQIIVAIIPIISAFIVRFINAKTNEIKLKTKNKKFDKYIDLAKDIVSECVISVNQTHVDSLKDKAKFSEIEQQTAFNLAKDKILSILNKDTKKALVLLYGDLEAFINTEIEVAVKKHKKKEVVK